MPNIMREFVIKELSCVDRPAQTPAKAVLMKRLGGEQEDDMQNTTSFDTLDEAIAAIRKAEGCDRSDAMSKAARLHPRLLEAYRQEGDAAVAKALARHAPQKLQPGASEFEGAIHGIMSRDRVDRATAMSRARKEHPEAFAAYQQA